MIVKEHTVCGRIIVTVCDKDLLGKWYSEHDVQLDLRSSFYKGEEISEEQLMILLKKVYTINVVGKNSIAFFSKKSLITKENIRRVRGIPYTSILF